MHLLAPRSNLLSSRATLIQSPNCAAVVERLASFLRVSRSACRSLEFVLKSSLTLALSPPFVTAASCSSSCCIRAAFRSRAAFWESLFLSRLPNVQHPQKSLHKAHTSGHRAKGHCARQDPSSRNSLVALSCPFRPLVQMEEMRVDCNGTKFSSRARPTTRCRPPQAEGLASKTKETDFAGNSRGQRSWGRRGNKPPLKDSPLKEKIIVPM